MSCSNTFRLVVMMILVIIYFFVELIFGYLVNSLSLVADSFHMLSDFVALCVGVCATRISKWPRSSKNTFGWQRAEIVGTLINTVMLATLCFTIFVHAIERFIDKQSIKDPKMMTFVGIGGLVINILGLIVIGSNSHSHTEKMEINGETEQMESSGHLPISSKTIHQEPQFSGEKLASAMKYKLSGSIPSIEVDSSLGRKVYNTFCFCFKYRQPADGDVEHENCHLTKCPSKTKRSQHSEHSMNMHAVFLHVLADFLGSIIVCVSALLLWKIPGDPKLAENNWKLYVDPTMSVIMVIIILFSTIPLLVKASLILLQSVPDEICIANLKSRLEKIDGIRHVHDLHVWKLQSNCIIGTVHILCNGLNEYNSVVHSVKQLFHENDIHCTTIQPEFKETENSESENCLIECDPKDGCHSDSCCPVTPNASTNNEVYLRETAVPRMNSNDSAFLSSSESIRSSCSYSTESCVRFE